MNPETSQELRSLLEMLNEWEQKYGTTYGVNAGSISLGESNARISDLKDKLRKLGAIFWWDGSQYIVEKTVEPGGGFQIKTSTEITESPEGQAPKPFEEE